MEFEPFVLGGEHEPPEFHQADDIELQPYLSSPGAWENYTDDDVYFFDKAIRNWIAEMHKSHRWTHRIKDRKYTFSMLLEHIIGEKYDSKKHARVMRKWTRICAYYSTRILNGGSINGKRYSKSIYVISPKRLEKPPYSLRLRIEWFAENGKVPNAWNMHAPKDDLVVGHARNPKTDANMERRRQLARQRYNERYNKPRHAADRESQFPGPDAR